MYQLCGTVTSAVAQVFFVTRIWNLYRNPFIVGFVYFLIFVELIYGTTIAVNANLTLNLETLAHRYMWLVSIWLATQATCDVLIAVILTTLLRQKRTGFRQTDNAIRTMIYFTVCTGGITCVLSIIVLCTFAKYGFEYSVLVIGVPLGGLYPVSMLANLHMRSRVRERLSGDTLYRNPPIRLNEPSQVASEQENPPRPVRTSDYPMTVLAIC